MTNRADATITRAGVANAHICRQIWATNGAPSAGRRSISHAREISGRSTDNTSL